MVVNRRTHRVAVHLHRDGWVPRGGDHRLPGKYATGGGPAGFYCSSRVWASIVYAVDANSSTGLTAIIHCPTVQVAAATRDAGRCFTGLG